MPRESLGKALVTCPQLLGVGIDSLRTGLEFLQDLGIPRLLRMSCILSVCVFVCVYTQNTYKTHTCVCLCVCIGALDHIYIYIYIYYMYVCMYIYTHTHTHTHEREGRG